MLKPGTIVADKYRIERVLGKGGMGMVYAARHNQLGTQVALKFLHTQMASHATVVERFLREARSSAQLRGEHICRVSDFGTSDGAPYIVMELLEGTDLARLLHRERRLPVERACDYVLQACVGIAEAHAMGIVHRDLKPGNLFLSKRPDGSPLLKVLDFGVAKVAPTEAGANLTQTSTVLGSPGYMSPEQLRSSKVVDARADIWALGAILYELLSGRPPFVADSLTELALKIAIDPTPTLPGEAIGLDVVIARCLEKEATGRFADVGELAEAIAPFASPEQRAAVSMAKGVLTQATELPTTQIASVSPISTAGDAVASASEASDQPSSTTHGRATGEIVVSRGTSRGPWIVALGIAVAGGVAFGFFLRGGGESAPVVPATPTMATTPTPAPAAAPAPAAVVTAPPDAGASAAPPSTPPSPPVERPAAVRPIVKHPIGGRPPGHRAPTGSAAEDEYGDLRK